MEIQLWSDFACPWCALGLYRLEEARARFAHGDAVRVVHRSFELDPSAPARRDVSMGQLLARKYGMGPEQVRAAHDRLGALGREVGFYFDFDRVQLGSTFDAHRLAQSARGLSCEDALVKALFSASFTEGRLLSDHGVLRQVAGSAGLDEHIIEKVLGSEAYVREVRDDEAVAQELGVGGVPYFLIEGAWAVPGAQDVETLVRVLDRAWARSVH